MNLQHAKYQAFKFGQARRGYRRYYVIHVNDNPPDYKVWEEHTVEVALQSRNITQHDIVYVTDGTNEYLEEAAR